MKNIFSFKQKGEFMNKKPDKIFLISTERTSYYGVGDINTFLTENSDYEVKSITPSNGHTVFIVVGERT